MHVSIKSMVFYQFIPCQYTTLCWIVCSSRCNVCTCMIYDLTSMIRLHSWTNILPWINITEYAYLLLQCRNVALFFKWGERETDIKILIGKKKGEGVVSTLSIILYFLINKCKNYEFPFHFKHIFILLQKSWEAFKIFFHILVCKYENKVNLLM